MMDGTCVAKPVPVGEPQGVPPPAELDGAAFEQLAQAHRQRALRFALAFLGDRDLAEDMVQEGLKRLFERRAQYPLKTHFGPYLVKTMARLCVDEKRQRQAAPKREQNLKAQMSGRASGDPAAAMEKREAARLMNQAVARLPQRERACLLLTVCEGMSYKEAAEALSLSFAEVNNAVHRARVTLRETLGPTLGGGSQAAGGAV